MSLWLQASPQVELRPNFTESDLQEVIRAVYRQVFGNAHLLECDRQTSAESLLRDGDITVRGFVRMVAQSELYRSLFFDSSSQYRFIELNCKHFLGRAPLNQADISAHVQTYNNSGYEADIDSYIDSDEYLMTFGENTVPSPRSSSDPNTVSNVGFNRVYSLYRGNATSDSGKSARLIKDLAANLPTPIIAPTAGGGTPGSNNKRFRVKATNASMGSLNRVSNQTYEVSYDQLNAKIKNLHRTGARILSITEV
jgi:hypothetical protein